MNKIIFVAIWLFTSTLFSKDLVDVFKLHKICKIKNVKETLKIYKKLSTGKLSVTYIDKNGGHYMGSAKPKQVDATLSYLFHGKEKFKDTYISQLNLRTQKNGSLVLETVASLIGEDCSNYEPEIEKICNENNEGIVGKSLVRINDGNIQEIASCEEFPH